jgi:hypothetical protein
VDTGFICDTAPATAEMLKEIIKSRLILMQLIRANQNAVDQTTVVGIK